MIFRVILGALISAVVMFVWGMIWWMALPFHFQYMHKLPQGESIGKALKDANIESGFYLHPWFEDKPGANKEEMEKEMMRLHREGPLVQVVFIREGVEPMDPKIFGMGFAHNFVCALLAGTLLAMAVPNLRSYAARVLYVFLLGVFAAVAIYVTNIIWMHHPAGYPLFQLTYTVLAWLWAGLVLAALVKPAAEAAA